MFSFKRTTTTLIVVTITLLTLGLYKLNEDIVETVKGHRKSFAEMVNSHGYPSEEHFVTTPDGYILCVHRIPHGRRKRKKAAANKGPILLGHGSSMGSTSYILGSPKDSLAYILADNGYDVWIINNRGNSFSTNSTSHTEVSYRSQSFWDFGFDEMSLLDYPSVIDYILKETKEKSLFFVGLSHGNAQLLALLSDLPEYNDKIRAGVLIAPAVFVHSSSAFVFRFSFLGKFYTYVSETFFGFYAARIWKDVLLWGAIRLCGPETILNTHCPYLVSSTYGHTTFDYDDLPAIADLIFQGTSYRQFLTFIQWHDSKTFNKYDFGSAEANLERYGVPNAPIYDLRKVSTRIHLILGGKDEITVLEDGLRLLAELPEAKTSKKVLFDYSHTDFVSSILNKERLFPHILKYLKKISSS